MRPSDDAQRTETVATKEIRSGGNASSGSGEGDAAVTQRKRVGRFELLDVLGEGGMGVVYRAKDAVLSRDVAIKMLRGAASGERRTRLLREAQAMAKLSHTNLVTVYEAGVEDGDVYIAMELVRGETLSAWLRGAPRDWREIVRVFIEAGRGLEAAHAEGIVHRDFKPSNVLVAGDGTVQVMDFGVAVVDGADEVGEPSSGDVRLTQTGVALGTPMFMSPEQHQGKRVDARTDQFSFAVALADAIYGEPPFRGDSHAELASAVCTTEPNVPAANGPKALREIVLRMLRREPQDRFPSMSAALAELEALLAERKSGKWIAIGGGLTLVVAGIAVAAVIATRDDDPSQPEPLAATSADAPVAVEAPPPPDAMPPPPDAAPPPPDATVATKPKRRSRPRRRKPERIKDQRNYVPPQFIENRRWRYSKIRCHRNHESKRCSPCCNKPGLRLLPYPNCGCYFDWPKFQRTGSW